MPFTLGQALAVALGGALGALLRLLVADGVYLLLGRAFPYGTLAVNVVGSLAMGLLYVLLLERTAADPVWRAFLLIGLLGAFTTFSTFSMETLNLLEGGEALKALANVALSVSLCLGAAWLGMLIGRSL